jgi:hypothetical protein
MLSHRWYTVDCPIILSSVILSPTWSSLLPEFIPMLGHTEHYLWINPSSSSSLLYSKTALLQHHITVFLTLHDSPSNVIRVKRMRLAQAG